MELILVVVVVVVVGVVILTLPAKSKILKKVRKRKKAFGKPSATKSRR